MAQTVRDPGYASARAALDALTPCACTADACEAQANTLYSLFRAVRTCMHDARESVESSLQALQKDLGITARVHESLGNIVEDFSHSLDTLGGDATLSPVIRPDDDAAGADAGVDELLEASRQARAARQAALDTEYAQRYAAALQRRDDMSAKVDSLSVLSSVVPLTADAPKPALSKRRRSSRLGASVTLAAAVPVPEPTPASGTDSPTLLDLLNVPLPAHGAPHAQPAVTVVATATPIVAPVRLTAAGATPAAQPCSARGGSHRLEDLPDLTDF